MRKVKNIVYIGGGTGSFAVLGGLRKYKNCQLTGVFPVTDDGGSTGRLIKGLNILPMGDMRKLLLALSGEDKLLEKMLDYRFDFGELGGHNFGNIFILCLIKMCNGINRAIVEMCKLLKIEGQILPVSLRKANLVIKLENGLIVRSETKIDEGKDYDGKLRITDCWVEPKVRVNPEAKRVLRSADLIVFGPGDLYTSVVACLIVPGMAKIIRESKAKKVYVCNLMTKFGQSNNFSVQDHVNVIQKYLGGNYLDYVIYNNSRPNEKALLRYKSEGESLVSLRSLINVQAKFIGANLMGPIYEKKKGDLLKRSFIRHNPDKLAKILIKC